METLVTHTRTKEKRREQNNHTRHHLMGNAPLLAHFFLFSLSPARKEIELI
jgi:hypothetical protein